MNKLNVGSLILSLAALCALPSVSRAQDGENRGDGVRLHLGTGLGVGGEIKTEVDEFPDALQPDDEDLVVTPNVHLGLEVPLHTYFTLGAELGLAFWNMEDRADPPDGVEEGDRQRQLDILARPKVRLGLAPGLELYGVVPVGFTYYISHDRDEPLEVDGGPGFAVGGALGASYFFTESVGITGEAGYLYRKFNGEVSALGQSSDYTSSFGQFQMNAGVTFSF